MRVHNSTEPKRSKIKLNSLSASSLRYIDSASLVLLLHFPSLSNIHNQFYFVNNLTSNNIKK